MKRIVITLALLGALAFTAAAGAWDSVAVAVSHPDRVTAGRMSVIDFRVTIEGRPFDLSAHGSGNSWVRPTVTFRKGSKRIVVTTRRTAKIGVYRARVSLPAAGAWTTTFRYEGLVRRFRMVVAG